MEKYKLIYVDEQNDARLTFYRIFEEYKSNKFGDLELLEPQEDMDHFIDYLFRYSPDAIIFDYDLRETNSKITYDGAQIVQEILKKRKNFPCFILTNFGEDAIGRSHDANIVYEKGKDSKKVVKDYYTFLFFKVCSQIEKYKKQILDTEEELKKILHKDFDLTAIEEERIIELDSFLENAIASHTKLPDSIKSSAFLDKLQQQIELNKQLIKKL